MKLKSSQFPGGTFQLRVWSGATWLVKTTADCGSTWPERVTTLRGGRKNVGAGTSWTSGAAPRTATTATSLNSFGSRRGGAWRLAGGGAGSGATQGILPWKLDGPFRAAISTSSSLAPNSGGMCEPPNGQPEPNVRSTIIPRRWPSSMACLTCPNHSGVKTLLTRAATSGAGLGLSPILKG